MFIEDYLDFKFECFLIIDNIKSNINFLGNIFEIVKGNIFVEVFNIDKVMVVKL